MNIHNNKEKGIDWDLCAAYENNDFKFTLEDIEQVLAVFEGENDAEDWRWVIKTKDSKIWYVRGGCDYTGWDCQSDVNMEIVSSVKEWEAINDDASVKKELAKQIKKHKKETWREKMDKELLPPKQI